MAKSYWISWFSKQSSKPAKNRWQQAVFVSAALYNTGFLSVFKSDWIAVSKNVFGFPKGPLCSETVEGKSWLKNIIFAKMLLVTVHSCLILESMGENQP